MASIPNHIRGEGALTRRARRQTSAPVRSEYGPKDILTGKRFMAHKGGHPGEREPLGVYWYEYHKQPNGNIGWVRHVVSYGGRIGCGMQIPAADIDGDGDIDFACPGKSGLLLFENLTKKPAAGRPAPASKSR